MELFEYWRLVIQNRILITATSLLGVASALAMTMTVTPLYQADAEVFVSTPSSAIDITDMATGSNFSQQRVKSYAQIIASPITLQPVIDELGLNYTAAQLNSKIRAVAPLDTVLISISVIDPSPTIAAEIANSVAEQFGITVADLELNGYGIDSPVKVSIVKEATSNSQPISPNKKLNYLVGMILGFAIGLGIAFLKRVADNTVKNEDDLQGLPLLAAIGFDLEADEKPLVTQIGRYAARTEAYRTLRTNIQFLMPDNHPQVIAMTSAFPSEGKTTSSINLSLSLTHTGATVVLVEADLRRPKISEYLELTGEAKGLSELISDASPVTTRRVKSLTHKFEGSDLMVISAGKIPQNPAELLSSKKFDEIIEILRKQFEYVIIDCPPLLPVTDAAIISTRADGCILVVHAGVTKRPHFYGARDALLAVGSKVLGVVINKIPQNAVDYEYGYRYGYSGYYGGYYRPNKKVALELSIYPSTPELLNSKVNENAFMHVKGKKFKEELLREEPIRSSRFQ
jgi:succinoglycan biosynthesis transport protein ExoP